MNGRLIFFAISWAAASAAQAPAPAPLTSLSAIHALSNAQASQSLPVAFQATVTYYRDYEHTLFVQDAGVAIYVSAPANARLIPGDRVLIKGTTRPSFHPYVAPDSITVLYHGALPPPLPASFDTLIRSEHDCQLVRVRGVVRAANLVVSSLVLNARIDILTEGGPVRVNVDSQDAVAVNNLLGAQVEVLGAASGTFDGKMQQTGVLVHAQSLAAVRILRPAAASPFSLPVTSMDEVLTHYHVNDLSQRVHVRGTITYYQPGSALVLQDGSKSIWIMTRNLSPLRIGDLADATGFPDVVDGFLTLRESNARDTWILAPVTPRPVQNWERLATSSNIFDLVSIEGRVVMEAREAGQDEYVLVSGDHLFSAIYRHPLVAGILPLPPVKFISLGSRVRVTGICGQQNSNPFGGLVPFNILLRSLDDISVVAPPSPLSVRNLVLLVSLLLAAVFTVGARGWILERRTRHQTLALAQMEQRRSRILEDINGNRPLAEIIEQIVQLVSLRLDGAPCWCRIADGALLGTVPSSLGHRITQREDIHGRSGPALGAIFAACEPRSRSALEAPPALLTGAELATLAIETRRLYSDLRHRSEFDLLTQLHNRFSLDRKLDDLIAQTRETAGVFGLIFVDLDRFKQVNDRFGHHIGDLYLEEAAQRMKRQLRAFDLLARLGGDEFAALVPAVRSRAEVEEIALRLEHSFDLPFELAGVCLEGTASVGIALYPEDGATKDALLKVSDTAMYAAKDVKQQVHADPVHSEPALA